MNRKAKVLVFSVAALALLCTLAMVAQTSKSTKRATAKSVASKPALPRMIDLGKTWCIPCKKMVPVIEKAKKVYKGRAVVEFIDLEKHPEAGRTYKIMAMPTQIFFTKDGKEFKRHLGYLPFEEIEKIFTEMGVKKAP